METKLIAFLILSSLIFFGWWYIQSKMSPRLADSIPKHSFPAKMVVPTPSQTTAPAPAAPPGRPTEERQIKIKTDYWAATLSNRGAVLTEWTMTGLPNGQPMDEFGGSVYRDNAEKLMSDPVAPIPSTVTWAAVDDNYFAMAFVPPKAAPAIRLLNDRNVSIAVLVSPEDLCHIYAGPKDLNLLGQVSESFGLVKNGSHLGDIISYSWLDYIGISFLIKPIAKYMLVSLRSINRLTQNFGWSIVIFTVGLNMLFFPLLWKSSVAMKRVAVLQPKMKDIQEQMKKLEKSDPRMVELQREQFALLKEGNPLTGCLPMLLQMPLLMTFYAILAVSIEVRHAPFIGWVQYLSSPDPYWVLPLIMGITMVVQQALTSTTQDPVQKKLTYVMPLIFIWFMKSAPAGLVLYWMVSNLIGIAQQFVINRLNPAPVNIQQGYAP